MRTRRILVAAGILLIGYAVVGGLLDPDLDPGGVLLFLVAVLVGHDLVWTASVLVAGTVLTRTVPRRHRPVARAAAICAAAVTVVAAPLVAGFGRVPDNPSVLPLPYGRNLLVVLLLIVATALVAGCKKSERPAGTGPGPEAR